MTDGIKSVSWVVFFCGCRESQLNSAKRIWHPSHFACETSIGFNLVNVLLLLLPYHKCPEYDMNKHRPAVEDVDEDLHLIQYSNLS